MNRAHSAHLLLAAFALLVRTTPGNAQTVGAIRGTVVDQTGRAVENAQVLLTPGSRSAITLDDGRFVIANITEGVYTLAVHRIGYEPATIRVGVRDSTSTVTVWLTANAAQLEAIRIREKSSGLTYSAVVLDQHNLPVAGAEVAAMGVNDRLKTDSLGRFAVTGLGRDALMLRIRKIGYAAYVNSFRIVGDRADTLRMRRLATTLSAVEIKERSGFGSDQMAYDELAQRMRWKSPLAGIISREELAQQGGRNLCEAIPLTPSGNKRVPISRHDCELETFRVLLNGMTCELRMLTEFTADAVESIEYYPGRPSEGIRVPTLTGENLPPEPKKHDGNTAGTDVAGSLAAHRGARTVCAPEVVVIWTRREAEADSATAAAAQLPVAGMDSSGKSVVLPAVEVREEAPHAYLQGQVVDSADRPLRAALVYTEDPLYATLTDKKGFFRLADLPSGAVTVRAERTGFVPIEFQLRLPPDTTVGIGLKLLRARVRMGTMQLDTGSDASTQGRTVRVVADNGQPIMFANVTLDGATTRITNEQGEINLGTGKRQNFTVRVSRIGFAPWFGKVDLPGNATMTVTLPQIAHTLATIAVNGSPQIKSPLQLTGFYDRWIMRQRGVLSAVFIGPEELEFRHPAKMTSMLNGLNGVKVVKYEAKGLGESDNLIAYSTAAAKLGGMCPMAVLVDGHQERPPVFIDRVLDANAVMAIEVYDRGGNMPIGLQADDSACGVIAFWTGSRRP